MYIGAFELWCQRRLLRVPWTEMRSNQSNLKEISPEYSSEGLMLKLKLQYFSPPDAMTWLIGKDPDSRKDWRQEEKGMTGDDTVGWHQWLDGLEFEQALGVDNGQGSLVCCSPWGHKESDTTEWLNCTELIFLYLYNNSVYLFIYCWGVFFLAAPHSLWDLSSLTRDWNHAPCSASAEA